MCLADSSYFEAIKLKLTIPEKVPRSKIHSHKYDQILTGDHSLAHLMILRFPERAKINLFVLHKKDGFVPMVSGKSAEVLVKLLSMCQLSS